MAEKGTRVLSVTQIGKEATKGTEANASVILHGKVVFPEDTREVVFPERDLGIAPGTDDSYIPYLDAKLAFPDREATYEEAPYFYEAGIKKVTPTQDGVGSGYIYTYPLWTTTVPDVRTYTIEGADNVGEEQAVYCFCEDFKIGAKTKAAAMIGGNWRGQQVAVGTKTAGLSLLDVEEILGQLGTLSIDNEDDAFGDTPVTDLITAWELSVKTGLRPDDSTDNNSLTWSSIAFTKPEVMLKMTFKMQTNAIAEKANWRNQVSRLIRLQNEGSTLTTPGTTYTKKTHRIDLAGKWQSFDLVGEEDGMNIVVGNFKAAYNATAAFFAQLLVVNELTALT